MFVSMNDILTTRQAAALLQVTERTVKVQAALGKIPACKVGQGWRFSREALIAHVSGKKPEAAAQ
jgi:excisionase family DNA binding protein